MTYAFDRFLRYDELTAWLHDIAAANPQLVTVESYGRSYEGRDLWLVTLTDSTTGAHHAKPAHWVDANIHSVEVTASVAALRLIDRLVTGFEQDETVTRALQTRTFYVVPRVNPDGAEWALADSPRRRRSSTRPWPWRDAHRAPGLHEMDVDGDGRVLMMRIADPNGAWMPSPDEARILVPVPIEGAQPGTARFRLLYEGEIVDHDGFTTPAASPPEALDMNRNFPAAWGTAVRGSGDHPLSEPEIDALVRAIVARPNICGYNAYHTAAGVLLRPSSIKPDSALPPFDVWAWNRLGERGTELTGYPAHSVFDDYTFDKNQTMSGASDDWVYEHLGIFGWTTEFWDVVRAASGRKQSPFFWYVGPTTEDQLAVLRWSDEHHHALFVPWYPFDHPQLGPVELGGWDEMYTWDNPPRSMLAAEVEGHADFAIVQALAAPCIEILHRSVVALGGDTWRVEVGVGNTGWLPTYVSQHAKNENLVLPLVATLSGAAIVGGPARLELGQLEGRMQLNLPSGRGSADRALATWVVRAAQGTPVEVEISHPRAGSRRVALAMS
ncbi:MAG TPA: M14 family metallopeptidase [Ilumatobacteraceae bacterium]|nr:M14 family metallopeptidase [Ilumatobacteraceae bacterium]